MRKLLYAILLSLGCFLTSQAQTVIFDPATFTGDLPNGMTIVDVDGTKYLQVILDGWNSNLKIPAVTDIKGTQLVTTMKYGVFHQVSYTAANIKAVVQVMDTINQIPNPWGAGTIPSNVGIVVDPAPTTFAMGKGDIAEPFTIANNIQFFGQSKIDWNPTSQDTIWCGKVYSFDASVIFDASAYAVGDSVFGVGEIVEDGGTKFMKISTIEWGPIFNIDPFETGNNNRINVTYKYGQGSSTLTAANAATVIKVVNGAAEYGSVSEHPSSETAKTLQGVLTPNKTVTAIQLFVQNTADPNWASVTGADVYISKITVEFKDHVVVAPSNYGKARKLAAGQEIVIDGFNDDESWDVPDEEIYPINRPALGTVASEDVSSGYFQALWDDTYLYLFYDLTDDDPIELDAASTSPWLNDGVEIFVDRLNRHYQGEDRIEGQQHQFRLNLTEGPAMGDHGMSNFFGDNDTTNIQFAYSKGGSYYAIEAAIPMAAIFRQNGATNLEAIADAAANIRQGFKIGFETSLIDASDNDIRASILNWANKTGTDVAYTSPEFWGQITLAGTTGDTVDFVPQTPAVKSLTVYPNPANTQIYIKSENVKSVEIYNIAGTKVLEGNEIMINVAELSQGLYIVKATDKNGVISVGKFNKQ